MPAAYRASASPWRSSDHMRTSFALAACIVAATVAGCGSVATVSRPGQGASGNATVPAGLHLSGVVTATCTGKASDADSLQEAIDSSTEGSRIEISGPICLLDKGITFLSDRTYVGY